MSTQVGDTAGVPEPEGVPAAVRWRQVRDLFDAALAKPPEERAAIVAALAGDEEVARDVLALLEVHDRDDAGLESGPAAFAFGHDDDVSLVGHRIGPYRLLREIGRGGMGAVYEAARDDAEYEKRVAVKVIKSGMNSNAMSRRFRRERQILAALDHPNIARLLDGAVTPNGHPYLVMELVDGEPIDVYCEARELGVRERITLFLRVCDAVDCAHRNLIVHRDLKPGNILVTHAGEPKLLDFGIAKLMTPDDDSGAATTMTGFGLRFFTPEYASPEQLRGEAVSTRSDVYSLGVVLYELLSGRHPFRADGRSAANIDRILATEPAPPSSAQPKLSGELDNIVMMALRKEPSRRYTSVEQLAEDLRRYLDGRPVIATRDTAGYRMKKFVSRHRVGVGAAAIVVLSLSGGVGAAVWQAHVARGAATRANAERAQAEQVTKFLVGILGSADPSWSNGGEKAGPKTTVLEAVQTAARHIGADLAGQPEVEATVRRTIGNVYNSLGVLDSGEKHLRAALELRRRSEPGPSRNLALDLEGLGIGQFLKGDFQSASATMHDALATFARVGDSTSTEVATTQNNLAVAVIALGQVAEAESLEVNAVKVFRRSGAASSAMANAYNNLAGLRNAHGDLAGAERYLRQSLAVYAQLHEREYYERGTALLNLAYALKWRGQYAEADSLLHEALSVYKRTSSEHPYAGYAYMQLAHLHYLAGNPALAESEIQRARAILIESGQPGTHADLLRVNTVEGLILRDLGRLPEAEALVRGSLPGGMPPPPPHDSRTAEAIGALGRILASRGRPAEAGPLLAQSHADFARAFGEADARTRWAARADSLFRADLPVGR